MEVDVGANDDTGEDQSDTDISGNLTPCLLTATHMAVMVVTCDLICHIILLCESSQQVQLHTNWQANP